MSQEQEACLVLYPDVTREEFEWAAVELGFVHVESRPSDGDRVAYEQVLGHAGQASCSELPGRSEREFPVRQLA